MEANRNSFPQCAQDPNDPRAKQIYHGSTFDQHTQDIVASTHSIENGAPREARLDDDSWNDNQESSDDGDALPGIEGFQIVGDPRPGCTVRACGFPINGTTLCYYQWVRYLEDGTRQSLKGATMYDYVVTADDVGALLAVYCTPMDDNDRQGYLVSEFANNMKRITCDPEMHNAFNTCMSMGGYDFDVFIQGHSLEEWEHATLVLKQSGYQINFRLKDEDEVIIDEKYSPNVQLKIPNGRTTQFVLVRSGGVNLPFNTQGITEPNTADDNVRLRDLIVLVMRAFQNKALMSPPHPIAEPSARTSNKRWTSSFFQRKGPGCVKLAMQIDGY